ncbi:MAG TPA: DUF4147 domain-containing protein [Thermoanaerobaculia bacterium]|nr:DUF4147 domain-containing protein [Thermoanaerobaculia bacterium]
MLDLERIYRETLRRCAPDVLVRRAVRPGLPRHVVAIGKCAAAMVDGFGEIESGFAVVPRGYPLPGMSKVEVMEGGHPEIDAGSVRAGRELLRWVDSHPEITFLISGGGSACADVPLEPFFSEDDLQLVNRRLVAAGIPIRAINIVRKHLSAIKGGRLAARVRERSVSLIYSDVASGDLASVASGPTLPDRSTRAEAAAILRDVGGCDRIVAVLGNDDVPETVREIGNAEAMLIADNGTLVETAAALIAEAGRQPVRWPGQIETDVATAAHELAVRLRTMQPNEVIVAGGEPTVVVQGGGRGGRCSELAVRFAMEAGIEACALFGSSDGVDGTSGAAGFEVEVPAAIEERDREALERSDSAPAASRIGRPIIMPPTGNNLRDLYLVARG